MNYHMGDWASRMRDHGFRVTPQRQLILEAIYESGGHTTPEEIYERVHAKAPAVNLATIYRTVDFLRELRFEQSLLLVHKTHTQKQDIAQRLLDLWIFGPGLHECLARNSQRHALPHCNRRHWIDPWTSHD